ncbi:MAG TPA: citryl-CoA lyase [Solirubrobacteraceae bacterium]|nr:citryl-CoA lyase [Solirubrobacteraceae bacterium]
MSARAEPELSGETRLVSDHWTTAITETAPGRIRLRGYPIEQVITRCSYAATVWLMLTGELPDPWQERLLDAALVAGVDHGPQAPSIAGARMAATCGVGLSQAVATGVNMLGDVHGGAGEACMQMLAALLDEHPDPETSRAEIASAFGVYRASVRYVPGFGHRMHRHDPRRDPLMHLVHRAQAAGVVSGRYLRVAEIIEAELGRGRSRTVPMNIDGATAVIYSELGFAPELGKGLFALSRSVGLLAHAYEQSREGVRIKGPLPPGVGARYTGPPPRDMPGHERTVPDA